MEAVDDSETWMNFYQTTHSHIQKYNTLYTHRRDNLTFQII
jgi:hypothetical protein